MFCTLRGYKNVYARAGKTGLTVSNDTVKKIIKHEYGPCVKTCICMYASLCMSVRIKTRPKTLIKYACVFMYELRIKSRAKH